MLAEFTRAMTLPRYDLFTLQLGPRARGADCPSFSKWAASSKLLKPQALKFQMASRAFWLQLRFKFKNSQESSNNLWVLLRGTWALTTIDSL